MSSVVSPPYLEQLVAEVSRLLPEFLADPIDGEMSKGNAAFGVIAADGSMAGRLYGADRNKVRWCHGIMSRKLSQVWRTGYATGDFETKVYAGELDEGAFGVNRPDFIGWLGGVPLLTDDGQLVAAAFSGFRGESDVGIIVRAVAAVPGLRLK